MRVRLGEVIDEDMIAVSVAGEERQLAVCSPAYRDDSACLRIRPNSPRIAASAGGRHRRPRPIDGNSPRTGERVPASRSRPK